MAYSPLANAIFLVLGISILSYILTRSARVQQKVQGSSETPEAPLNTTEQSTAPEQSGVLPPTTQSISTQGDQHSPSNSSVHRPLKGPMCFRISGIPMVWSSENVKSALREIDPIVETENAELSGPFPDCSDSSQCALLNLDFCTDYFTFSGPNDVKHISITEDGKRFQLSIDKNFYDLTPMNKPEKPIVADIIAITGLGGHAFGSWRSRASTDRPIHRPMWIRDFLPEKFPNTRIMTYGYDSSIVNPNRARMTEYRRDFTQNLRNSRRDCLDRPIIFIGHSMGGLLLIQVGVPPFNKSKSNLLIIRYWWSGVEIHGNIPFATVFVLCSCLAHLTKDFGYRS
ncbi:hypothetical protein P167DRAFT_15109 [Morchella conica CCBAS932]|uniref:DUF676 domain-containing protein n=1 Tax=Morchella conica CCBAS932 TaxID=1392247 RepID=A0A3N4KX52_9PEZI|nr:hypothetical protein P167DRAFT_15109 [Morchella conica CCBAS932]